MNARTSEVNGPTTRQRLAEKYAAQAVEAGKRGRLHHSPLFWSGVLLFVVAISVYVFTDSLAWLPLRRG